MLCQGPAHAPPLAADTTTPFSEQASSGCDACFLREPQDPWSRRGVAVLLTGAGRCHKEMGHTYLGPACPVAATQAGSKRCLHTGCQPAAARVMAATRMPAAACPAPHSPGARRMSPRGRRCLAAAAGQKKSGKKSGSSTVQHSTATAHHIRSLCEAAHEAHWPAARQGGVMGRWLAYVQTLHQARRLTSRGRSTHGAVHTYQREGHAGVGSPSNGATDHRSPGVNVATHAGDHHQARKHPVAANAQVIGACSTAHHSTVGPSAALSHPVVQACA